MKRYHLKNGKVITEWSNAKTYTQNGYINVYDSNHMVVFHQDDVWYVEDLDERGMNL